MIDVALKPVENSIFSSCLVLLAEYHCRPDDPLFANSGPSNAHSIVFPLTSTRILKEGSVILEAPTAVTLFNAGVEYSSEVISAEGSHCAWMSLDSELLLEIVTENGDGALCRDRPFPVDQVAIEAPVFMRQKNLFRFARRFGDADPLKVEEESIAIAEEVAARIRKPSGRRVRVSEGVIERARSTLAAHFAEPLSLADVARQTGVSSAYLSRTFRSVTGQTMHAFREELRLRRALDLLPDFRGDFTRVALDLGYSSHSHFSSRFRRYFGLTPVEFVTSGCGCLQAPFAWPSSTRL